MRKEQARTLLKAVWLVVLLAFALAGVASAAPPELTEEDIPPPAAAKPAKPKPAPRPAVPVPGQIRKEEPEAVTPSAEAVSPAGESAARPEASARPEPAEKPESVEKRDSGGAAATDENGDLTYLVRTGDTPSSIADAFHVDTADLLRANHLGSDTLLHRGMALLIPDPFAAQVRALKAEIQKLNDQLQNIRGNYGTASSDVRVLHAQVDELMSANEGLRHDVRVLPWWRAVAMTAALAAALLVVIFAVALFDWFVLRRRFRTLVEMNESLRRLDHKYKAVLAKAELRFQQLYGRRRLGALDGQNAGKTAEEAEIERLNRELKETLEANLERLGSNRQNGSRRSLLRDLFGAEASPAAARSERR